MSGIPPGGSGQNPLYPYGFGNPQQTQHSSPYGQTSSPSFQQQAAQAQGAFPAGGVWSGHQAPQSLTVYRAPQQPSGTQQQWMTGPQRNAAVEAAGMIPGLRNDLAAARQEAAQRSAAASAAISARWANTTPEQRSAAASAAASARWANTTPEQRSAAASAKPRDESGRFKPSSG